MKLPPIENMTGVFDVRGMNVVVTGGNRGIGYGISKAFAQSGCNVAILCRNTASGEETARELSAFGTEVFAVGGAGLPPLRQPGGPGEQRRRLHGGPLPGR